jgi:hypothetical protein
MRPLYKKSINKEGLVFPSKNNPLKCQSILVFKKAQITQF